MTSLHHKKEMQEHLGNISNRAADKGLKKRLLTQTHSSRTPLQRSTLQCWFVVVDLYLDSMSTETVMHWLVNQCSFIATNNLQQLESVGDTLLRFFSQRTKTELKNDSVENHKGKQDASDYSW